MKKNNNLTNKGLKIPVYLVPHSHWDREWYFSFDTANVLLHHNFGDFEQKPQAKWFLDGQWSLVDDLAKWKPQRQAFLKTHLSNHNLAAGPLYSQPDVFNSQGETIIRNFEMGQKIAKQYGQKQLKTAYLPDTFGFGQNLPQILKHCQIDNLVFWRGIPQSQLAQNDLFYWKGLGDAQIKTWVLREGYFALGMHYPYNKTPALKVKNDLPQLLSYLEKCLANIKGKHQQYILPLGGDQAPYLHQQQEIITKLNQISEQYEFILVSNYDDFFNNKQISNTLTGDLKMPITGKIHRTIGSSRYDIKKAFRDAEDKLYYLLEPLEILYQNYDGHYDFETYKDENIHKPLLIAQSHDSLGACNTDATNQAQLDRLTKIQENIDSQVDLLIKKILQKQNITAESLAIFNPAPFVNDYWNVMKIYSSKHQILNLKQENLIIKSLASKEINFSGNKKLYEHQVLIMAYNLKPLQLNHFILAKQTNVFVQKEIKTLWQNNQVSLQLGKEKIKLSLSATQDEGDAYDFSPGKPIALEITNQHGTVTKLDQNQQFIEYHLLINNSPLTLYLLKTKNNLLIKAKLNNKMVNTRVELNVEMDLPVKVYKSQNLALSNFAIRDAKTNWKQTMSEYPADVDINDGLISLANKINILTKGNNEFYLTNKGIKLTLFRTYNQVSKPNLKWRPSSSGLNWKEPSPASQLAKELTFDLVITTNDQIKALNQFKFSPYAYYLQNENFIANKMSKFIINDILTPALKPIKLVIPNQAIFISSLRRLNNKLIMRAVNMEEQNKTFTMDLNHKSYQYNFKPYEIKKIIYPLRDDNYE